MGAVAALRAEDQLLLSENLAAMLAARIAANNGRAFGICKTCTHHRMNSDGAHCALLLVPLAPAETTQICYEQEPA